MSTTFHFAGVAVWRGLGTFLQAGGHKSTVSITDPNTGLTPAGLTQNGVAVTQVTADFPTGHFAFSTTDVPAVMIDWGFGPIQIDAIELPAMVLTAAATTTTAIDNRVKWQPSLAYALGQQVISPSGDVVTANTAHTSSSAFTTDAAKWDRGSTPKSLADFGVLPGNTASQNRAAFTAAAASAYSDFTLPPGTYNWSAVSEGNWMMSWTGRNRLRIRGLNAVINDTTSYTNNGALTGLFLLDGCKDFEVSGIEYVGPTLGAPGTDLGYTGATLVRAINGTDGVKVDMRATNCRYGVQTGDYATASTGSCKNFDIKLRGTKVGYSVAAYLADGIRVDVDVDGVHRILYFAGCNSVSGKARYKNQYIAPIACLITDTLTSGSDATAQVAPPANPTTSRGCTNVDLDVTDAGSTTFVADSYVAGISLQRVDPCTFSNINIRVYTSATDTVSTTVHGFLINSVANTVWSRYTNNWESTVVLENVSIGGVVDKSATTVTVAGGSNGPITIRSDDPAAPTHFGTLRNLTIRDFMVKRGTQTYIARIYVRGLATPMVVDRLTGPDASGTPALYVLVAGSTTQPIIFNGSTFATLDMAAVPTNLITLGPGTVVTAPDLDRVVALRGGTIRGAGPRQVTNIVTASALSGASVTLTGAIPAGATDVRIQGRVITAITGASGFQLGVSGDLTRYADITGTGTGTLVQPYSHAASAFTAIPSSSATNLIVTAKTANFTAGAIRLVISYWEYPAVAS